MLVEVVEHDLGDRVALEHDDQALPDPRRALVADVGDAGQLALAHQLGDLQREVVGIDLVRELGDDQSLPALVLLDLDHGPHGDRAAPGAVGVLDPAPAHDERLGREVGPLDQPHGRFEQLFLAGLRVFQGPLDRAGDLAQVVRRDVGGHADGDAARAVDQQLRDARRQDVGLLRLAVVVGAEVDGLLVDVPQHLHGDGRELALGVAHRRRRVVAGRAEVALPVDQRISQRPRLGQADQRVVDRGVAVWVVGAHHVADDAGALEVAAVGTVATVVHRVEHPPVHRFEPVAHVRQRPGHDDGHRVVHVTALHLGLDVHRLDAVSRGSGVHVRHR